MAWEIERKESEENLQLGSRKPSGFDNWGRGVRRTGWKVEREGRASTVLYLVPGP